LFIDSNPGEEDFYTSELLFQVSFSILLLVVIIIPNPIPAQTRPADQELIDMLSDALPY
jgi:hypothetical protein